LKRQHARLKAWLWFLGIYLVSLLAFATVTGLLRFLART
jgi:hypothetical protein